MCGRFRQTRNQKRLEERFDAYGDIEIVPRFNIAPSQPVITVRQEPGQAKRHLSHLRWGLLPSWAADPGLGYKTINARSETVTTTPSFSGPFKSKRCLVPADGFYEWKKSGRMKQPYCFEMVDGELFAFAGLWDEWIPPTGEPIQSCTILTTTANALGVDIHDRMPVILDPDNYELWLNPLPTNLEASLDLLKPFSPEKMHRYPVSSRINQATIDDADCAKPVAEAELQANLFGG